MAQVNSLSSSDLLANERLLKQRFSNLEPQRQDLDQDLHADEELHMITGYCEDLGLIRSLACHSR